MPRKALFRLGRKSRADRPEAADAGQDTRSAIAELSRAVRDNPASIETYLALGNLYRSQGEIERAIRIREGLIGRRELPAGLRARSYFELGRDFRRGGLIDKSRDAFFQAARIMGDTADVRQELAMLAADAGEFELAAEHYAALKRPMAQAHYLARRADEAYRRGEDAQGKKFVERALRVFPTSPEAWLAGVSQAARTAAMPTFSHSLRRACENIPPDQRFLLLEGLLDVLSDSATPAAKDARLSVETARELADVSVRVLSEQPADALLCFYCARLRLFEADRDDAKRWLEKSLSLNSDFWLARLELVGLVLAGQEMTPFLREQLAYFVDHARTSKRFICRVCAFRWDRIFFVCPRCRSWHSIKFRQEFT